MFLIAPSLRRRRFRLFLPPNWTRQGYSFKCRTKMGTGFWRRSSGKASILKRRPSSRNNHPWSFSWKVGSKNWLRCLLRRLRRVKLRGRINLNCRHRSCRDHPSRLGARRKGREEKTNRERRRKRRSHWKVECVSSISLWWWQKWLRRGKGEVERKKKTNVRQREEEGGAIFLLMWPWWGCQISKFYHCHRDIGQVKGDSNFFYKYYEIIQNELKYEG